MSSLPFDDFDPFPRFPEDFCFGGFGPVQSAMMLEGEGGELVSPPERPWKKVVTSEARAATALKSHSEAERRRRERINAHLCTLRSLVPGTDKVRVPLIFFFVLCVGRILMSCCYQLVFMFSVYAKSKENLAILVQSAIMLEGEGGELVNTQEKPWKKVVMSGVRAATALKSHSEAERRRRERINAHLSTLRSLLPGTDKLDKAGLLAEVISYVRELKVSASEISKECNVPADADEVKVEVYGDGSNSGNLSIKASLCCEDRPELLTDLRRTVQSLHLKTAKAEISTLGGRVKNVFVMTCEGNGNGIKHHIFTNSVHQALSSVLEKVSSSSDFSPSSYSYKRRRLSSLESSSSSS
ncbi:hypothetical protein Taro_016276 [Colocasia esculenta]|uniref:BHLH domain-containing protein n=1 Tax=Colocasia esculenta TaxID=4460 RepID=A0A843UPM7_COLES|nr:hypothetical protein [Colocasia esculenta]